MLKTVDTLVKISPQTEEIVSADEIFEGPITDSFALSGEERDWFKSVLYGQIKDEDEKSAFVELFRKFLEQYPEVKLKMMEEIRNKRERSLKGLLKRHFLLFLEQWNFNNQYQKP